MPLPVNSSISLQGPSRPGESTTTMPNIAMVVRMTEETLDALQSLSGADRVDFEFGDKPGIIVHDKFFAVRYDREKDNQELFIRTTQPNRTSAPLKLNANIVGKFSVEKQLSEKISQQLRTTAALAAKQKAERKAILVDSPPVTTSAPQKSAVKKKGQPKSTPVTMPTVIKSYSTSIGQTPTASASTTSIPPDLAANYRQRLIHYLALGAATEESILKEFGGREIDFDTRSWVMSQLTEIAEKEPVPRNAASKSQQPTYILKPRSWLEVRPHQYSGYTDNVRVRVSRDARAKLASLKIPETDPAWEHVRYRATGQGSANSKAQAVQRAINGTTTAQAKAKAKAKVAKAAKNTELKVKSEAVPSARPSQTTGSLPAKSNPVSERTETAVRGANGKGRETDTEKEEGELSASQTPPRITAASAERRPPSFRTNAIPTSTMPPPPVPVSSQPSTSSQLSSSTASKRPPGPADVRGPKRPAPETSERTRAAPPIPPPAPVSRKPVIKTGVVQQRQKERASLAESEAAAPVSLIQSAKDKQLAKRERERDKESDRESIRATRKERDSDRESIRKVRKEKDSDVESIRIPRKDRERESDRDSVRGYTKEKLAKDKDYVREREYERSRDKVKEQSSSSRPVTKASTKRNVSGSSGEESSDWGYEESQLLRKKAAAKHKPERERDSAPPIKTTSTSMKVPHKDSPPPKLRKTKRETSPPPPTKTKPPIERKVVTASSSNPTKIAKKEAREESMSRSDRVKTHKRRRSIDFTSSSDDEEDEPKTKTSKTTSKTVSSMVPKNSVAARAPTSTKPRPTLSKHDQLRARYSKKYNEYIMVFQKLVAQKNKVVRVAAHLRHGSESPSGDSDLDADLMPLDELEELTARHQRLYDELEEIKRNYMT